MTANVLHIRRAAFLGGMGVYALFTTGFSSIFLSYKFHFFVDVKMQGSPSDDIACDMSIVFSIPFSEYLTIR